MNRARHATTWDAIKDLHPAELSKAAKDVLKDYYNSLGANIPDPPTPINHNHVSPDNTRAILTHLKANPYAKAGDIAHATGIALATTYEALNALNRAGVVTRHRHRHGRHANTWTVNT